MTQVWRLHVRPDEGKEGMDPTRFCIEQGVVGVDWGDLDGEANADITAAEYEQRARSQGYGKSPLLGWVAAFNALEHRMEPNDLCWTRDTAEWTAWD